MSVAPFPPPPPALSPEAAAPRFPLPLLATLRDLARDARFLDAHAAWSAAVAAGEAPPLPAWTSAETWPDADAALTASRLAWHWGDGPLHQQLSRLAFRLDPSSPKTLAAHITCFWTRHGPAAALRLLNEHRPSIPVDPGESAHDLALLEARLLAIFRDFTAAWPLLDRVREQAPDYAWGWVERCAVLETEDRHEEALAAAREAVRLRPWYPPAVSRLASTLLTAGRDDEALTLLTDALARTQAGAHAHQLVLLCMELEDFPHAAAALDQAEKLQPLMDKPGRAWIAARRSEIAWSHGDGTAARAFALQTGWPYFEAIAKRIDALPPSPPFPGRVRLPVRYIRQHHVTCVPATLAMIADYWQRPVDHLSIASEICYDGTSDLAERNWIAVRGWVFREFRIDWETTKTLIDRGCPFTLVTTGIRSGHMQAVIGYDAALRLLILRDPGQRSCIECLADEFLKDHAVTGPRGVVLVPPEKAPLLEGITFADATLYDLRHTLQAALARHDRPAAETALARMQADAPGHPLTLRAAWELASSDRHPERILAAIRALRALFPDDVNLRLDELAWLDHLGRASERLALLREAAGRRNAPSVFLQHLAETLRADARRHPRALRLLARVLRRDPVNADNLRTFAHLLWEQRAFADAAAVYRLAACTGDKTEQHQESWFAACRHLHHTEECLALLRDRVARWGHRSSLPVRTLFTCLEALDREPEAFAALDNALTLHPDDGALLLFAAEARARHGRLDTAQRLLADAASRSPRAAWLRSAAHVAAISSDHAAALARWRELLEQNPADTDATGRAAALVARIEGRAAELAFLADACRRLPHLHPLRRLHIERLRDEPAPDALSAIDDLLAQNPDDAWALREKALILRRLGRAADALPCAEAALRIEPSDPASHGVCATILDTLGRRARARAAVENGLRLSIDADWLYPQLVDLVDDFEGRRAAVLFLHDELARQPFAGAPHLRFREVARAILPADELGRILDSLRRARPECWSAWSALVRHRMEENALPVARDLATEATCRFPLLPRLWSDLAAVHARDGATAAEIDALRKALELSPGWSAASLQLAAACERALRLDDAEHALRRAIAADPVSPAAHGHLADFLWCRNRREEAFASIEQALRLAPGYGWAWQQFSNWSDLAGTPARAMQLAEEFTRTRPGEADSWLRLSRLRTATGEADREKILAQNLADLDRAAALDPRNPDIHDHRAWLLATHGRHDEALAACSPAVYLPPPASPASSAPPPPPLPSPSALPPCPHTLEGRAAWVESQRGNLAAAIGRMAAVVARHPDYTWGWACLAEWHFAKEEPERALEAATRWAWLEPDSPVPLGHIADAHHRAGRNAEAADALRRALAIAPDYQYGAGFLMQLLAAAGEPVPAARHLRHIETHCPPATVAWARVLCHTLQPGERDEAAAALASLARIPDAPGRLLGEAVDAMLRIDAGKTAADALAPLLADPAIHPDTGPQLLRALGRPTVRQAVRMMKKADLADAHRARMFGDLLDTIGREKQLLVLRWLVRTERAFLRAHDLTWGMTGYAWNCCNRPRQVIRWTADWATRPDAEAWMLHNRIDSLYETGRIAEARATLDRALTLPGAAANDYLQAAHGCELALAGRASDATAVLARFGTRELPAFADSIRIMANQIASVQLAPAGTPERHAAWRKAHDRLAELGASGTPVAASPALRIFRRRALHRIAQDDGSLSARLRSFLLRHRNRLWTLFWIAVPVTLILAQG
ncbi:hypothetical protein OpiT1DRAFT_05706 [Opitutaceae bacterium TAV1]|nr:hypothetical protein OpiT1DRAFT_05706 [Opitutaceae bacterium TAV1]